MTNTYSSAGDLGDFCYAIPTIIQHTGNEKARVILYAHIRALCRSPFYPEKVSLLAPLIESQSWCHSVEYGEEPVPLCLDHWRTGWQPHKQICESVCERYKVPHWPSDKPWLVAQPRKIAPVIFARSERYQSFVDYAPIVDKYKGECIFVGTGEEHARFQLRFGKIPFYPTPTCLDLAETLMGGKFLMCNQSFPCAVGIALGYGLGGKYLIQEVDLGGPNCVFRRPLAHYTGIYLQDLLSLPLPDV